MRREASSSEMETAAILPGIVDGVSLNAIPLAIYTLSN